MSDPYLILHKVRGEPAFDVAVRLETEEEIWIVPTSGHRAYPYEKWDLGWFSTEHWDSDKHPHNAIETCANQIAWADWPDHYQVSQAPHQRASSTLSYKEGQELLEQLGFKRAPSTFVRRI